MQISRGGNPEQALEQNLPRRRGKQVRAAHDVGDSLLGVVHDHNELVSEQAVGATHDKVADFDGESLLERALSRVIERDCKIVDAHPGRSPWAATSQAAAASAGIDRFALKVWPAVCPLHAPDAPQNWLLVFGSTHVPLQLTSPCWQESWQVPPLHTWPGAHTAPPFCPLQSSVAPQNVLLVFGSMQVPPQLRRPCWHVRPHVPALQS